MVGPSCSLLHCPIARGKSNPLDAELRGWMAFAKQKLGENAVLARGLREGARDRRRAEQRAANGSPAAAARRESTARR